MKKTITAILLGILLIGTLGAVVVSAVASNDTKTKDDLGQMHNICGRYMNSGTMHNMCGRYMNSGTMHSESMMDESMHNMCGRYMSSDTLKSNTSNLSVGQK